MTAVEVVEVDDEPVEPAELAAYLVVTRPRNLPPAVTVYRTRDAAVRAARALWTLRATVLRVDLAAILPDLGEEVR